MSLRNLNSAQFGDKVIAGVAGLGMAAGLTFGGIGVHKALTEDQPEHSQIQPVPQPVHPLPRLR